VTFRFHTVTCLFRMERVEYIRTYCRLFFPGRQPLFCKFSEILEAWSGVVTAGIGAEYNPFHLGHQYQVERLRAILGECAVVAVMSGNFVQRGEPAIAGKLARAEAAVRCGVDLVLELPTVYAASTAEIFARGG